MGLKEYQKKRKFTKTPEPKGKVQKIAKNRFVVQEHWASHHHFDFRLEMEGVLKSWAVPKGLPEKKGIKRLAVQVEDHPVDYINFQGEIPKGLYGAGTVKIFDKGIYELINKAKDRISFKLKDKKLKGEYRLIKTKLGKNQWLLIRTK
jgi:bifunctional non-homologous end joining protein LigD